MSTVSTVSDSISTSVSVALPIPIEQVYTYRIPHALSGLVRVGSAVMVPFGRRTLTGVVTELNGGPSKYELKDILDVVDPEPVVTPEQLELTRWIAEYYLCSWGEAIRASLPPGTDSTSDFRVRRVSDPSFAEPEQSEEISSSQRLLLQRIPFDRDVSVKSLRRSAEGVSLATLRALEALGFVAIDTQIRGPRTRIRTEQVVRLAEDPPPDMPRGKRQVAVIEALTKAFNDEENETKAMSQADLLQETGATSATVRRLEEMGYLKVFLREVDRSAADLAPLSDRSFELNDHQATAVKALAEAIDRGTYETFLIHGITGSGKTEVYIEALRRVRSKGKSGIILVPEIALTPQTVKRFRSRFGNEIAVLHSRMSAGERFDAWRGIRSGESPIVIGPRSAILAPVQNLGLIVVDEEHEPSYKQFEPAPRYHARDAAIVRARNNGAVCVLGSATPSLESLANAQAGKYGLLTLPDRVETAGKKALLPKVRVVDLRSEPRLGSTPHILSQILRDGIQNRIENGQQTILLQNRRGYSPLISCESCAWIPECPDCSVSMTWHKAKRHLRCHYCGRTARLPGACPSCGEPALSRIGIGTQRVEEELIESFPEARIARMDLDTTSTKNAHHDILEDFAAGKYDILLGTQMVAKGLDFEKVTLVGVIDADTGLSLPDIRAEERSFHLLTQVAGRAGRADLPGEVIFQTRNPGHRIIQFALRHDYSRFAREILSERMALGYPPAGRLVAIVFSGPDEASVFRFADRWAQVATSLSSGIELLGPSTSFVGRVRRQYRFQVMIKIPRSTPHQTVRDLIRRANANVGSPPRGCRFSVDVDPIGLS